MAAPLASFTARCLGFPRGSWLSSRTQLLVGFSATGMIHVFGDWAMGHSGGSFPFFILQALAIAVEDAVIAIAKTLHPKLGDARWTRVVGYMWTIAWFSWSTVLYADWLVHAMRNNSQRAPYFIIAPTLRLFGIDVYQLQHLYPPVILEMSS